MDTKSDSLLLSYNGNEELKKALGDLQPGDTCELKIEVTVRANDEEAFDAMIDSVERCDDEMYEEGDDESEEGAEKKVSTRPDKEDDVGEPALVIVAARKPYKK